jgi:signal transduction histidine kinase
MIAKVLHTFSVRDFAELYQMYKDKELGLVEQRIPENIVGKLFKVDGFVKTEGTLNESGTGLGLILCKEFIGWHKGKIWVESKIDEGSKFSFSIPK